MNNTYVCQGTDTIEASRLDGRHRRVVVRAGLSEPRALALVPARGWLYWSDWGARAHIGRAGMDGSGPHVRLAARLGWPNALTVAGGRLYFADARDDYIAEADLELRSARVLLARADLPALRLHHAFALQAWAGRLYWSDWETRAVESCRRRPLRHTPTRDNRTADAYDCRTLLHTVHKPMDLRVFHPARQPPHPGILRQGHHFTFGTVEKSSLYKIYSMGLRTLPWGTPARCGVLSVFSYFNKNRLSGRWLRRSLLVIG